MAELAQEIRSQCNRAEGGHTPVHTYALSDLLRTPLISVVPSDMAALEHSCIWTWQAQDSSPLQAEAHSIMALIWVVSSFYKALSQSIHLI